MTYEVDAAGTSPEVIDTISDTDADHKQTITFSDAKGVARSASVKPAASYLTAPTSGSAANVVTVTVVDQYGKPVRGHPVRLDSDHSTGPPAEPATGDRSTFPVARRTDSSGTVRIGYSYKSTGSVEELNALTKVTTDDNGTVTVTYPRINLGATGADASFYWARPASAAADLTRLETTTVVHVFDADNNTLIIGGDGDTAPLLVRYDDNDQYTIVGEGPTDMAGFEAALAKEFETAMAAGVAPNDTVAVTSYDHTDASDVATFVLTVAN